MNVMSTVSTEAMHAAQVSANKYQRLCQPSMLTLLRGETESTKRFKPFTWFSKGVAYLISASMLWVYSYLAYAQGEYAASTLPEVSQEDKVVLESMSDALQLLKEKVAEQHTNIAERMEEESSWVDKIMHFFGFSKLTMQKLNTIDELQEYLPKFHTKTLAEMNQTKAELEAKVAEAKIPAIALERHNEMMAKYRDSYQKMLEYFDGLNGADNLSEQFDSISGFDGWMEKQKFKRTHQKFDPNKLKERSGQDRKAREPATTKEQLDQILQGNAFLDTSNDPSVIASVAKQSRAALSTLAEAAQNLLIPTAHAAQDNSKLDTPELYLGESVEVELTDAIRAKAAELNHDPIAIYNYVRNTIEFVPTFGSMQNAQMTMEVEKGNAFDTASLLIALLRASDIPARYAYGVIEVKADKVNNWVGGTENASAAQNLMGQGGIPNRGLVTAGRVSHIQMEHVWVEAFVDFIPSRGSKNIQGDSWIPMDASYKQYEYTKTFDIQENLPFDTDEFIQQLTSTATIDDVAGYVQNLDIGISQTKFDTYVADIRDMIVDNESGTTSTTTIGETLGAPKAIIFEQIMFSAGLPYKMIARTNGFADIPNNMQVKYNLKLVGDDPYANITGNYNLNQSIPVALVSNKGLALSFKPATESDEQLLRSYIPAVEDGDKLELSQLPNTIDGYQIDMIPELTVEGQVVASGQTVRMGTEMSMKNTVIYASQRNQTEVHNMVAGEYIAIGGLQMNVSPEQFNRYADTLESILNSNDSGEISKHDSVGIFFQTGALGYFMENDTQDRLAGYSLGVISHRLPSPITFSSKLSAQYLFGLPSGKVQLGGVEIDAPIYFSSVGKSNQQENVANFYKLTGPRWSANEHLVPERLLTTENITAEGVSAIKLINIAMQSGQKVYTLTQDNISELDNISIDSSSRADIRSAVSAGKEVVVHESPITVRSWTGSGYIAIDPRTGLGGYIISGGKNGGFVDSILTVVAGILGFADGLLGSELQENRVRWRSEIDHLKRLGRGSGALALLSGIISSINSYLNGSSGWNLLGQIAMNLLVFSIIAVVTSAIVAAAASAGLGFLGAIAAAGFAALFTWAGSRVNSIYFSD